MNADYHIESVWPQATPEIQAQVVQFWQDQGAIPNAAQARERASELLLVVHTPDKQIAAVSTARSVLVRQLGLPCYYYRMFVARDHRSHGLATTDIVRQVLFRSYQTLNARFVAGTDRDCVGLYMEIENPSVQRNRNETIWQDFGANAVYIGKTPAGHHARVWYFEGSRID